MASSDWGHDYTDDQIEALEKRLAKLYKKTAVDARKKMDEHFQRFADADKDMRARVKSGDLSQNAYNDWRRSQIISGQRWDALSRKLAEDYAKTDEEAREIIWQATPDVYAENYNYSTYLVEQTLNADTSFSLYNRDAAKAALTETNFMPRKVKNGITDHYRKKIQETAVESILLGEGVSKLAKRIAVTIGNSDMKYATSIARTFMGKAQNQARYDAHGRAKDIGIECELVWLATLDGRTRHSHAALDGEVTGNDGKFENGLRFPCDTENGTPADWMNCRCRTLDVVDGVIPDMSFRSTEELNGMTYEEWKEQHAEKWKKEKEKGKRRDGRTRDKSVFKDAKSIGEAESYALRFIKPNSQDKSVSFKGLTLKVANRINRALTYLYDGYSIEKLSRIYPNNRMRSATAAFDLISRELILVPKNLEDEYKYETGEKKRASADEIIKKWGGIENMPSSFRKWVRNSVESNRLSVGVTIEDTINHEMGHGIHFKLEEDDRWKSVMSNRKKYQKQISGYACEDEYEYIAESFCSYMRGENVVDPLLIEMFEELKRYD